MSSEVIIRTKGITIRHPETTRYDSQVGYAIYLASPELMYSRKSPLAFQMLETLILHQVYFNMHNS